MDVVTAAITAEGETIMPAIPEAGTAQATAPSEKPKGNKRLTLSRTSRARCARQGQVGKEGQPGEENAQGPHESKGCEGRGSRRQQDR